MLPGHKSLPQFWPVHYMLDGFLLLVDFKALKRGDVAISSDYLPAPPEAPSPVLYISKENFQAGENVSFQVKVEDFKSILGVQQTFEWDPNLLEFQSISGNGDYMPRINDQELASGKLPAISFLDVQSSVQLLDGEELYTINFTALADSPADFCHPLCSLSAKIHASEVPGFITLSETLFSYHS